MNTMNDNPHDKEIHFFSKIIRIVTFIYTNTTKLMSYFKKTALSAFAGQAAFFMMLSFFPFFMFLLSLLRYTPFSENTLLEKVLRDLEKIAPLYFRYDEAEKEVIVTTK